MIWDVNKEKRLELGWQIKIHRLKMPFTLMRPLCILKHIDELVATREVNIPGIQAQVSHLCTCLGRDQPSWSHNFVHLQKDRMNAPLTWCYSVIASMLACYHPYIYTTGSVTWSHTMKSQIKKQQRGCQRQSLNICGCTYSAVCNVHHQCCYKHSTSCNVLSRHKMKVHIMSFQFSDHTGLGEQQRRLT